MSDGIETDLERTQGSPERSSYFLQRRFTSRSNRFLLLGFRFRFVSCKKVAVFIMGRFFWTKQGFVYFFNVYDVFF